MSALCFVDANALLHARDASEPEKQSRARLWLTTLWEWRCGRTEMQVLNESLHYYSKAQTWIERR